MSEGLRRRVQRAAGVTVLLLLVVLASVPLFVLPSVDDPPMLRQGGHVDAVVVLGGGFGERVATAVELLPHLPEPPPTLVLSVPYAEPLLRCGEVPGLPRVTPQCLVPAPLTTGGEAVSIVTTAQAQGWSRIVVVTSDFHVTRARALVTRCVEALAPALEVAWVAADTDSASLHGLFSIATEWPSLLGTPWDHEPACGRDATVG